MPQTKVRTHNRRTKNGKFTTVSQHSRVTKLVTPPNEMLARRKFLLSRADWTRSPVTYKRENDTYRNPKTGNIYKKVGGVYRQVGNETTKEYYYGAGR